MSTDSTPTEAISYRSRWRRIGFFVLLLLAVIFGAYRLSQPDTATLTHRAELEFIRGEHDQALETVEQVLIREPDQTAALVLAGDASFAMQQFDQALDYYRRVPAGSSKAEIHAPHGKRRGCRIRFSSGLET